MLLGDSLSRGVAKSQRRNNDVNCPSFDLVDASYRLSRIGSLLLIIIFAELVVVITVASCRSRSVVGNDAIVLRRSQLARRCCSRDDSVVDLEAALYLRSVDERLILISASFFSTFGLSIAWYFSLSHFLRDSGVPEQDSADCFLVACAFASC